jgi:hypothetical protein
MAAHCTWLPISILAVEEIAQDSDDGEDKTMRTEQGKPNWGVAFYQCRRAREAGMREIIFDLTTGLERTERYMCRYKRIGEGIRKRTLWV